MGNQPAYRYGRPADSFRQGFGNRESQAQGYRECAQSTDIQTEDSPLTTALANESEAETGAATEEAAQADGDDGVAMENIAEVTASSLTSEPEAESKGDVEASEQGARSKKAAEEAPSFTEGNSVKPYFTGGNPQPRDSPPGRRPLGTTRRLRVGVRVKRIRP